MSHNYLIYLAGQIKLSHQHGKGFRLPKMTIKDLGELTKLLAD